MPLQPTQDDVLVSGARLHYYRAGEAWATKPSLVLQHGFSDNGLCWEAVAQELALHYDIVMPDARGHGLSARVQEGEVLDQAADLAGLIRALGLLRPVVAGHSMGAAMAADLGARFPDVARALILEDPPWFMPREGASGPRTFGKDSPMGQWILGLQKQTLEQVMADCRAEHPNWPEAIVRRWCEGKMQLDPNFLATARPASPNWQETVPQIACPVLLITADPDKGGIVTDDVARQVVEANPRVRVVHIPGVGHHIRFAEHAVYMQAVRTFLQEISRPA
jgi:N-formylmaleamate deformylase